MDIEEALSLGADYLVVGRPIKQAANRKAAAEAIQRRIAAVVGARPNVSRRDTVAP